MGSGLRGACVGSAGPSVCFCEDAWRTAVFYISVELIYNLQRSADVKAAFWVDKMIDGSPDMIGRIPKPQHAK